MECNARQTRGGNLLILCQCETGCVCFLGPDETVSWASANLGQVQIEWLWGLYHLYMNQKWHLYTYVPQN